MSRATDLSGLALRELSEAKLILTGVIEGKIPKANHLYINKRGGGRTLSPDGRAFKNRAQTDLGAQWMMSSTLDPLNAYVLVLKFYLPKVLNKGYPKTAASLVKRVDTSGLVKVVEDVVAKVTGVDDCNNFVLLVMKKRDPERPRVEIYVLESDIANFID